MAGLLKFSRRIYTSKSLLESLKEPLNMSQMSEMTEHKGDYLVWKRLFFFVCCPAVLVSYINVVMTEEPERPEFKKYPHLRIRKKPFPWGDGNKTLFHNPHRNALPEGYEDEINK